MNNVCITATIVQYRKENVEYRELAAKTSRPAYGQEKLLSLCNLCSCNKGINQQIPQK